MPTGLLLTALLAQVALTGGQNGVLGGEPDDGVEAGPLGAIVEDLGRLELTADMIPDQLTISDMTLDLSDGERYLVRAGDRAVGLFFIGSGRFTFTSRDPISAESFHRNVKRATGFKVSDGTLAGGLDKVLILGAGVASDVDVGSAGDVSVEAARAFSRHVERFADDRQIIAENMLAQALLDPGAGSFTLIQMQTEHEDLIYLYDGVRTGEANLAVMRRFPTDSALRGSRYPQPLVSRVLTDDWLRRDDPRFTLRHVDFTLRNQRDAEMRLEVEERFELHQPVETIELSLWSESFHRRKRHEVTLASLTRDDGTPLEFSHRDGDLVILLDEPAEAGQELVLHFVIEGEILRRPGGDNYWWLPIGSWLPMPVRFDMRSYTVHGTVGAASPFVPFAMGRTIRRWQEDDLAWLEFELVDPIQFAVVLAGKYHSYTETRGEQTIALSSYAFALGDSMRQIADNTFGLIDYYERVLGQFPYRELNIVEINQYGFGVGPPGVIYMTAEGFDPGPTGRSFRREINKRFAHEVAHQYWGHVAQMRTPDDQWLSESTAEYFAALAVETLVRPGEFKEALRDWQRKAGDSKSLRSIYMANRLAGERAALDRHNLLYAKGPLMLHDLRQEIGDEAFFELMRRFVDESRFEHIDTAGFIALSDEVTGTDSSEFFRQRLFGLE